MSDQSPIVKQIDAPDWESKIELIKRTVAVGATNDELELFFHQARRAGLDPLQRQIYCIKRQGKATIQVGIDGYRLIAHRTGECAGIDDAEFTGLTDRGFPAMAKVVVYRFVQGQRCAFSVTARWDEFYPGDQMGFQWKKMPHVMLGKVAEAQALRKAFPAELGGMYVDAEMDQAPAPDPQPAERTEEEQIVFDAKDFLAAIGFTKTGVVRYTADCKAKNIDPWRMAIEAKTADCQTSQEVAEYVLDGIAPGREVEDAS